MPLKIRVRFRIKFLINQRVTQARKKLTERKKYKKTTSSYTVNHRPDILLLHPQDVCNVGIGLVYAVEFYIS